MAKYNRTENHSNAWVIQVWISFILSISATTMGIMYLPVDNWIKGYLGMGLFFTVASTTSLSKTVRDLHESQRIISRVDEAKLERILSEHDPFKK
jgi:hypothetical protein